MKKYSIVMIALLYSLVGVNMLFAAANTWTQKADVGGIERYSAVGFSIGSKGYIGTGHDSHSSLLTKDFWEYDPEVSIPTPGDLNGDSRVTLADAILALKILAGMTPAGIITNYPMSGNDVNVDGNIGMAEVIYILQTLSELRPVILGGIWDSSLWNNSLWGQ